MNIVVSGWPGSGSSTLSILLAFSLKIKLYRGSSTFRILGQKLNFQETGKDRIQADEILEKHYGQIYDKYNAYILETKENILVETDYHIADKRKNKNIVSYFLACSTEERTSRLKVDKREGDSALVEERDLLLQEKYKELFNIDWFNLKDIEKQYDVIIDNTDARIYEELILIYNDLMKKGFIKVDFFKVLATNAEDLEKNFLEKGKEYFINKLKEINLLMAGEEILKEINIVLKDDIKKIQDEELKRIILELQNKE